MKNTSRFFNVLILAMCVAVAVISEARGIIIIDTKTGAFGLTAVQTARVGVVNAAVEKGGINPCVVIRDMAGNLLAEFRAREPLQMGQGTFFDFNPSAFGLRPGERLQIRVEVELEGFQQPPDPLHVLLTLEVFDNDTGKTASTVAFVFGKQ